MYNVDSFLWKFDKHKESALIWLIDSLCFKVNTFIGLDSVELSLSDAMWPFH